MLSQFVRQCFGWEVWSTIERDDPVRLERTWNPWRIFQDGYLVGTWTGPKRDLFCVVRCSCLDDAALSLAPPAPTVTLATLASLLVRVDGERRRRRERALEPRAPQATLGRARGVEVSSAPIVVGSSAVLDKVVPIVKRRYARELAMVSERLAIPPL